jgi:hypothetical protein
MYSLLVHLLQVAVRIRPLRANETQRVLHTIGDKVPFPQIKFLISYINLRFFFSVFSLLRLHEEEFLLRISLHGIESGKLAASLNTPLILLVPYRRGLCRKVRDCQFPKNSSFSSSSFSLFFFYFFFFFFRIFIFTSVYLKIIWKD